MTFTHCLCGEKLPAGYDAICDRCLRALEEEGHIILAPNASVDTQKAREVLGQTLSRES